MKSIQLLWDELESWFNKNTDLSLNFNKGASEEAIKNAEKEFGIKFPSDFREHLLCHDGQDADEDSESEVAIWMPGCGPLLSLKQMVKQWKLDREGDDNSMETALNDHIYQKVVHPQRIPIAGNQYGDGDLTYLDLFPGPKGKEGQLITLVSECDFVVLDESFHKALERYLRLLETGDLYWSQEEGVLQMKNADPNRELAEAFALENCL